MPHQLANIRIELLLLTVMGILRVAPVALDLAIPVAVLVVVAVPPPTRTVVLGGAVVGFGADSGGGECWCG